MATVAYFSLSLPNLLLLFHHTNATEFMPASTACNDQLTSLHLVDTVHTDGVSREVPNQTYRTGKTVLPALQPTNTVDQLLRHERSAAFRWANESLPHPS